MSKIRDYFIKWNLILASIIIVSSLYCLLQYQGLVTELNLTIWILVASIILAFDMFLSEVGITVIRYILINSALIALSSYLLKGQLTLSAEDQKLRILFIIFTAIPLICAAVTATQETRLGLIMVTFDAMIIFIAIFIGMQNSPLLPDPYGLILYSLASMFGLIWSLVMKRLSSSGSSSVKVGGTLLILLLIVLVCITPFLFRSEWTKLSQEIALLSSKIFNAIIGFFTRIFTAFFEWLSNLFHPSITSDFDIELANSYDDSNSFRKTIPSILAALLVFAVIGIVLVAIFLALRGIRLKKTTTAKTQSQVIRNGNFRNGSIIFRKKLIAKIKFIIAYLKGRNTSTGLYYWTILWAGKHLGIRKAENDSPMEFLQKVSLKSANAASELAILSGALEQSFYAGTESTIETTFSKNYRKVLKKQED